MIAERGLLDDRTVFIAHQSFHVKPVRYKAEVLSTRAIGPPGVSYYKSYHRDDH